MVSSIFIAKSAYGGDGLGRLGDGRVAFVPGAFTGESVKAEIVEERRNYVKARLVEIEEASPERTGTGEPPVPGMVYANLTPAGEAAAKEAQLREFLERARFDPGLVRRATPEDAPSLNYRNKAVYHFAKQGGRWAIGYRKEPSHEIMDVESDPLARPEINARLTEIRRSVVSLLTQGAESVRRSVERKADVTVRWSKTSGVQWWIGEAPQNLVMKEVTCGKVFEVPAGGFYQVNPVVGEALARDVAAEFARGGSDEVLDLYCGVGVFGLACAPARLTGIESGRQAVEFAKRNAASQGAAHARFFAEQVGRSLRKLRVGERTTVIVDPPRSGMEPNVPKFLAGSRAGRVFYVSCDPATLVRDLKVLAQAYEIESVRWYDMFPRTARFETFVSLRARA